MPVSDLQLEYVCLLAKVYSSAFGLPCGDPAFWLMRAITPAIAGEAADVPPISCAVGSCGGFTEVKQAPLAETQIRYALPRNPGEAKKETSGISRLASAGIPVTPACQLGFAYPPVQLATVALSLVVQLLAPPPAPTVFTKPERSTVGVVFAAIN